MSDDQEAMGPELTRLTKRLYEDMNTLNFHADWGPEALGKSVEELARMLNDVLDRLEAGDYEEVEDLDD